MRIAEKHRQRILLVTWGLFLFMAGGIIILEATGSVYMARTFYPMLIILPILLYNYRKKRFEIIAVQSDHIVVSRPGMTEKHLYADEIESLILRERQEDIPALLINANGKFMNIAFLEPEILNNLLAFAENNQIDFYTEDLRGFKEKVNTG